MEKRKSESGKIIPGIEIFRVKNLTRVKGKLKEKKGSPSDKSAGPQRVVWSKPIDE